LSRTFKFLKFMDALVPDRRPIRAGAYRCDSKNGFEGYQ
jgi:hypothetical protein